MYTYYILKFISAKIKKCSIFIYNKKWLVDFNKTNVHISYFFKYVPFFKL